MSGASVSPAVPRPDAGAAGGSVRAWLVLTGAAVLVVGACVLLGFWQLGRAAYKAEILAEYARNSAQPRLDLDAATTPSALQPFRRVRAVGRFDGTQQVLVDNQVLDGRPALRVYTPLAVAGSSLHLLVDRGLVPFDPNRRRLPEAPVPAGDVEVVGILQRPPGKPLQLGGGMVPGPHWGAVWPYLDSDFLAKRAGIPMQAVVLREGDEPGPAMSSAVNHRAYALQWFAFASVGCVVYAALVRRGITARR